MDLIMYLVGIEMEHGSLTHFSPMSHCRANQLTGFCVMPTFAFNELNKSKITELKESHNRYSYNNQL